MSFWGKHGHLTSVELAIWSLQDIAANVKPEELEGAYDINRPIDERYDKNRLLKVIEGCQMVIWLNGGTQPVTWLPMLFDRENYRRTGKG